MPICPNCGEENPAEFRLCGYCGASLAEPATERRKLATLVFCDLSGSTALGERADSETGRSLMLSYFHEMRSALEVQGGTVEKFIGDRRTAGNLTKPTRNGRASQSVVPDRTTPK